MATWMKLSDHSSDNESTNDTEIGDEPIDLKRVDHENHHHSNDWESSLRLIKAKAFSIKDILGLDETDKLRSTHTDNLLSDQRKITHETLNETSK